MASKKQTNKTSLLAGEKPFSEIGARKNSPLRGRNLQQVLAHKGGSFLPKASQVKEEKRKEMDRGDEGQRQRQYHKGQNVLIVMIH